MGKQIRIVQSALDEKLFLDWLDKINDFVSLPREMDKPPVDILALGSCQSRLQTIILKEFKAEVLGNVQLIAGKDFYHVYPKNGLCIEWDRTRVMNKNNYCSGRLYYEKRNAGWPESAKKLTTIFNKIIKYINKVSPKRSVSKYPIYVGADLNSKQLKGKSHIVFPNGEKIELEKNKN